MSFEDDGDPDYSPTSTAKFLNKCDGGLEFEIKQSSYLIHVAIIPGAIFILFLLIAIATVIYWFCAVECFGVGLTNKTVVAAGRRAEGPGGLPRDSGEEAEGGAMRNDEDNDNELESVFEEGASTRGGVRDSHHFRPEKERSGLSVPCLLVFVVLSGASLASLLEPTKGGAGTLSDLDGSVRHVESKLGFIEHFVGNLTAASSELVREAEALQGDVAVSLASCANYTGPLLVQVETLAQQLVSDTTEIESTLGNFLPDLHRWKKVLRDYGITYRNDVLLVLVCLVGAAAAAELVTVVLLRCGRTPRCGQLAASLTLPSVALVVVFVSGCAAVTLTTVLASADFCMQPTTNVLDLVPKSSSGTTSYYLTCGGSGSGGNPAQGSLDSASFSIRKLVNDTATLQKTLCGGPTNSTKSNAVGTANNNVNNATDDGGKPFAGASSCCAVALPAMALTLTNTSSALASVNEAAACDPFMEAWQNLLAPAQQTSKEGGGSSAGGGSGLCEGTLEGLVWLWAALCGAALCTALYLLMSPRAFAHLVADAKQLKEQRTCEAGFRHLQEDQRQQQAQFSRVRSGSGGGGNAAAAGRRSAAGNPLVAGAAPAEQPLLRESGRRSGSAEYEDDVFFFGESAQEIPGAAEAAAEQRTQVGGSNALAEFFTVQQQHHQQQQNTPLGDAVVVDVEGGASNREKASPARALAAAGESRSALL